MSQWHRNNPDSEESQALYRENRFASEVAIAMAEPLPTERFHLHEKLDELKSGHFWLWRCTAEMSDGSELEGTVQAGEPDHDNVASETFERDD